MTRRHRHASRAARLRATFSTSVGVPAAVGYLGTAFMAVRTGDRGVLAAGIVITIAMTIAVAVQRMLSGQTGAHLREMEHRVSHDELTGLLARDELRARLCLLYTSPSPRDPE